MRAVKFDGELDATTVRDLIGRLDDAFDKSPEVDLYFSSTGGSVNDALDLIHYMNERAGTLRLICNWAMSSSALEILLAFPGPIFLGPQVHATIHRWTASIDAREEAVPFSGAAWNRDSLAEDNRALVDKLRRGGLSPAALVCIECGGNVTVGRPELSAMIGAVGVRAKVIWL